MDDSTNKQNFIPSFWHYKFQRYFTWVINHKYFSNRCQTKNKFSPQMGKNYEKQGVVRTAQESFTIAKAI